jgi:hypothetical protein
MSAGRTTQGSTRRSWRASTLPRAFCDCRRGLCSPRAGLDNGRLSALAGCGTEKAGAGIERRFVCTLFADVSDGTIRLRGVLAADRRPADVDLLDLLDDPGVSYRIK